MTASDERHRHERLPEPTLRRLPWYLAYLKLIRGRGETVVSSTRIGEETGVTPVQVAKDLSYINISGKTRVGYEVDALVGILDDFLGFSHAHRALLFGVGQLGAALMRDAGLGQYGLDIVAGFDVRPELVGTEIEGIPVYHIDHLPDRCPTLDATIAVITVPVEEAQRVTDQVLACGIRALWNFTPFRIRVPHNVVVQNTSIYANLAVMFNRLNSLTTR